MGHLADLADALWDSTPTGAACQSTFPSDTSRGLRHRGRRNVRQSGPLEVALSCEDVTNLIASHADKDLILIDTIGRSQRNREQLPRMALEWLAGQRKS